MTHLILRNTALALVIAGCAGFAFTAPALADKGGHGHYEDSGDHDDDRDHDSDRGHWNGDHDRDDTTVIVIENNDRREIRDYITRDYHHHCPPGLAKKHNGCLPPGQAKKLYRIGERLPDNVVFVPVPDDLRRRLGPVPSGYEYVKVDKDVLLISEASKKVIDAVTLLSAVGNQ
jgi:Ni/Co efflux regulator RcnB